MMTWQNSRFHRIFLQCSENGWLEDILGELSDLLILARRTLTVTRSGQQTWLEHERVVISPRARDRAEAESAISEYIRRAKDDLRTQREAGQSI
jgi:DNA-binding GntR family transcriptional regulator